MKEWKHVAHSKHSLNINCGCKWQLEGDLQTIFFLSEYTLFRELIAKEHQGILLQKVGMYVRYLA